MSSSNADEDQSDKVSLTLGAVVGALLVGLAWITVSVVVPSDGSDHGEPAGTHSETTDGRSEAQDGSGETVPAGSSGSASRSLDHGTYLDRCREVFDTQTAPLGAIEPALSQWEVHIGAMNKLVVGAITLEEAMQFWNQTRVGAHAKLDDFAEARRMYGRRVVRCPSPGSLGHAPPGLRACQQAVAARARTIRRGTTALETWRMHVHHMDMLRDGEMTPEEATRLWLMNWRLGVRQVHAFKLAAGEAEGLSC